MKPQDLDQRPVSDEAIAGLLRHDCRWPGLSFRSGSARSFYRGITTIAPTPPPHPEEFLHGEDAVTQLTLTLRTTIQTAARRGRCACLLTGGIDSSLVAAVATAMLDRPPLLLAAVDLLSTEEQTLARRVAAHLGTTLTEVATPRAFLDVSDLVTANDGHPSPRSGAFASVYDRLCTTAIDHGCSVLFTGDGGNELFEATPRVIADLVRQHRFRSAATHLGWWAAARTERSLRTIRAAFAPWSSGWSDRESDSAEWMRCAPSPTADMVDRPHRELIEDGWPASSADIVMRALSIATTLPISIAADIEVVAPLATPSALAIAVAVDPAQRTDLTVPAGDRAVLRAMASRMLPAAVAHSRKVGLAGLFPRLADTSSEAQIRELLLASPLRPLGIDLESAVRPGFLNSITADTEFQFALLLTTAAWLVTR